jgi:hypothetical protein
MLLSIFSIEMHLIKRGNEKDSYLASTVK